MNIQQFEEKLIDNGYRATLARKSVFEALLGCGGHITADNLYDTMRKSGSSVGRMTVFRTLDLLAEIGVIRPIYQGSGAAHFILFEDGHHHHLVCTQCSQTVEFNDCSLADALSEQLAEQHKFQIAGHLLEIYGLCEDCSTV